MLGRRKVKRVRIGDVYTADDVEVSLEEIDPATEPTGELSEPWNTDKIPRERWRSSGD